MADYWVSNKKKYCEICKCWFADNKISVENHERGEAHKINVQKRLRDMSRKAKERESEQGHLNATLIAMEQAALASMRQEGHVLTAPPRVMQQAPSVSVQPEQPSKQHQEIQKIIDKQKEKLLGTDKKKKRKADDRPPIDGPTFMEKVKAKKDFDGWKKKVQAKSNWDVRKMASANTDETTIRPKKDPSTSKNESTPYVEPPVYGGIGPWVPIVKEAPTMTKLQIQDAKKIKLDDLPEQDTGKKGPDELLFDEDEHDAEIDFKERAMPITNSNKSKPIAFRKVKPKNVRVKDEIKEEIDH